MLCDSDTEEYFKNIFCELNVKYINLSSKIYKINERRKDLLTKMQDLQIKNKSYPKDCNDFKNNSSLNCQDNIKLIDSKITELTSTIEVTFQKIFSIYNKSFVSYTEKIYELNQQRVELLDQIKILQIQYKSRLVDQLNKQDEYNKQDEDEDEDEDDDDD